MNITYIIMKANCAKVFNDCETMKSTFLGLNNIAAFTAA